MSDQDLFPEGSTGAAKPEDLLKLVTREDGSQKYATMEELVKGTINAQEHIRKVEAERKALEERLQQVLTDKEKTAVEKALEELRNKQPAEPTKETPPKGPELSKEAIAAILQEVEAEKQAEKNYDSFKELVLKEAGSPEAANKLIAEKAAAAGLSVSAVASLAKSSPVAAARALGLQDKAQPVTKTTGTVSTTALPKQEPERKKIMLGGATTNDIVEAFRRHKQQ